MRRIGLGRDSCRMCFVLIERYLLGSRLKSVCLSERFVEHKIGSLPLSWNLGVWVYFVGFCNGFTRTRSSRELQTETLDRFRCQDLDDGVEW